MWAGHVHVSPPEDRIQVLFVSEKPLGGFKQKTHGIWLIYATIPLTTVYLGLQEQEWKQAIATMQEGGDRLELVIKKVRDGQSKQDSMADGHGVCETKGYRITRGFLDRTTGKTHR